MSTGTVAMAQVLRLCAMLFICGMAGLIHPLIGIVLLLSFLLTW